jgi:hypothetical protein
MKNNQLVSASTLTSSSLRSARRLSASLAVAALLAGPQTSLAQQAVCIDPPPIGGTPAVGAAPVGWAVAQNSPDIISGNGPWPGGSYTTSDVAGSSTSGGTMGLFLNESTSYVESWQTTLTGLTAGTTYQVAIEWQQATLAQDGGGSSWSGGQLRITVDGDSTDYTSTGSTAGDGWQPAVKIFTATGPTANLVLGHTPQSGLNGMVVADSGEACSIVGPTAPTAQIPTLPEFALGGLALLVALLGAVGLRSRRRNPQQMV